MEQRTLKWYWPACQCVIGYSSTKFKIKLYQWFDVVIHIYFCMNCAWTCEASGNHFEFSPHRFIKFYNVFEFLTKINFFRWNQYQYGIFSGLSLLTVCEVSSSVWLLKNIVLFWNFLRSIDLKDRNNLLIWYFWIF